MAFFGGEADLLVWSPQPIPEDLLTGSSIQLLGEELPPEVYPEPAGFIIQNWFGPFLLAPPSRFLRGRC